MSVASKFMGILAGASAVAVIGVAVAQGVEPNPDLPNHPIAAGQQSSHETPMGETGVLAWEAQLPRAAVAATPAPTPAPVATAPAPAAPAPVAAVQRAPEPAPAAAATSTMGAAPAERPVEVMAQARVARADRN
jgi:hypothetical protein